VPNCVEFYRLRDLRTVEYAGDQPFNAYPVHVEIDDTTAHKPAGQVALLALANQLARVHRRITFGLRTPSIPLRIAHPFGAPTLAETLLFTVSRVDPCGDFAIGEAPATPIVTIGIGERVREGLDWYVGAERAVALLANRPLPFSDVQNTRIGAALASCLGASAAFRTMLGMETLPRELSAWNYAEGQNASPGPETLEPIDLGRVLMVGAGAVASALVYWLMEFGTAGDWTIIDPDEVILHNTNRGLLFTPADAGWPAGEPRFKAEVLSRFLPNSRWDGMWYHESDLSKQKYDLVLGLANDHNVRHFIASRNHTVVLHATTGENWLSQLHRHIAGLDDCIWCRAGEVATPAFKCSTSDVQTPEGKKADAALPFLSAASGLMLATVLARLSRGELSDVDRNDWRWDFGSPYRMASSSSRTCREDCRTVLPVKVRQKLNEGTRWAHLDGG
jgi:ThiF family